MKEQAHAPVVIEWSLFVHRLEDYIKRGTYSHDEIISGESYEKLLGLYDDEYALIDIPYILNHNRIFYYLKDVMDFVIRNRPDKPSKLDALFKHMAVVCIAEFLRTMMMDGGYLSKNDISLIFGIYPSGYKKYKPEFQVGNIRVWTIEQVKIMAIDAHNKKSATLRNHHLFGLANVEALLYTGRCNEKCLTSIKTYLDNPNKDESRQLAKATILNLLETQSDLLGSIARHI